MLNRLTLSLLPTATAKAFADIILKSVDAVESQLKDKSETVFSSLNEKTAAVGTIVYNQSNYLRAVEFEHQLKKISDIKRIVEFKLSGSSEIEQASKVLEELGAALQTETSVSSSSIRQYEMAASISQLVYKINDEIERGMAEYQLQDRF